jgi:hypothetical protein
VKENTTNQKEIHRMTYQIQFINSKTNKIFHLPTTYTDRTEACVCGQNYCRDRQLEDGTVLFFRLVEVEMGIAMNEPHPICGGKGCDKDCQFYPTNYDVEGEENEEPSSDSLAELLSVFSAIRPNY